jgi:uncharacterized repeat protein (TIGR01451 family)
MFRSKFMLLVAMFIFFAGLVAAYSDLGGGWCGCTSCVDCTAALNDNTICSKGVEADGGTYVSVSTYCIDRPVNFSNGKIFDMNGSVFDGSDRSHGIWLWNNTNLTIANGSINDFSKYGIILQNVTYADVHNVTINGTTDIGAGIFLGVLAPASNYDSYSIIYNCTIIDNFNSNSAGILVSYADNNEIWDVVSSRNAHGIWIYGAQDNYVHDCITDSSTGAIGSGIYCYSLVDRFSARNVFERINASSNPFAGIGLLDCADSTVNHSRLLSNNVGLKIERGAHLGPHNIEVHDNLLSSNTAHGIFVMDTPYTENSDSRFYNNIIQSSTYGIYLNGTKNNTFMDNRVSTNTVGILVENATNTSFNGDMVRVSTSVGLWFMGSDDSSATDVHLYRNLASFVADANGVAQDIQLKNVIFDNPLGNMQNYTNLSVADSLAEGEEYEISWTSNSTALPGQAISFENKWVDISTILGAPSIDEIVWHWTAAEEALSPDYVPAQFRLVEYDGTDWSTINDTSDTGARTLSAYALNPASDYGILQYVANVSVLKIDQTAFQASPGGIVEFNITINNTGNITLDTVQVIDELPAGLQWAGYSPDPPDSCTNGECTWNNTGPLAPGAATTILINASVDAGVVFPGNEIVNLTNYANATGTSSLGEILFAESEANATVYYANVSAVKTASNYNPTVGQKVTFNLTITNTGESNLTIWANDTLPAQLSYVAGEADPLPSGTAGQNIYWDAAFADVIPGETVNIIYNVTVVSSGSAQNNVIVTGVPPSGDNVTDNASVTLTGYKPPSGGGGDWKDLEIEVDEPVCLGEETVITVKVGSSEFENAEIHIKTLVPGYTYWYTGLGATDSEGELTFTPEFVGEHTIYADTDEHGYDDAQESFDVVECEPQEAECMENEDCPDCYDCEQHRDPAYNQCVLAEGANCGIYDPCPPASECQETEENPCPDPDSIPICIDCVCDWVECITDDDCPSGEECIDYECTDEETPPEEGCTTNETCEYDEYCDIETGECVDLECICGYPANHACVYYECCDDETCEDLYGDSFYCNLDIHECEEIPGEGDEPGLDVDTPGEGSVGEPVTVTVTSEDEPVPGAEVTIVIDGTPYGMGATDGEGQLEFTPDQPGDYIIQVSKEGFALEEEEFVATSGETIWDLIIKGVWILLFILILIAILYVLASRKKKRRPKDVE